MDEVTLGTQQVLESRKNLTSEGVEYWLARDIMPALGYSQWQAFEHVIQRAIEACEGTGISAGNHFIETTRMVGIGSGASRGGETTFYSACLIPCRHER